MSTEKNQTIAERLDLIMRERGFRKDTELAAWLGCSKQTLQNWRRRDAVGDYALFTAKGISEHWIRTGEGGMTQNKFQQFTSAKHADFVKDMSTKYPSLADELPRMAVKELRREIGEEGWELLDCYDLLCSEQKSALLIVAKTMAAGVPGKSRQNVPQDNGLTVKKFAEK